MIFKKEIIKPVLSLLLLSAGGWLLHVRRHPITDNPSFYIPYVIGLINIFVTPILFNHKKTAITAYLFNGFGVIIGMITMFHFSLSALPEPATISSLALRTTFADVVILLPKLFIGQIILQHFYPAGLGRMFTAGWWSRHFAYMAIIYFIGQNLLR